MQQFGSVLIYSANLGYLQYPVCSFRFHVRHRRWACYKSLAFSTKRGVSFEFRPQHHLRLANK